MYQGQKDLNFNEQLSYNIIYLMDMHTKSCTQRNLVRHAAHLYAHLCFITADQMGGLIMLIICDRAKL